MKLDATELYPGLYQGSAPPLGGAVKKAGFGALALCAMEYMPPVGSFGKRIYVSRIPLDDAELLETEAKIAWAAAHGLAHHVTRGTKTLITCMQGRNRSGLLSAMILHIVTGRSGSEIVMRIRSLRKNALTNTSFVRYLRQIKARGAPRR